MRPFVTSLVVAFLVLSAAADNGATSRRSLTGTVAQFKAGQSISLAVGASQRSVGMLLHVALSETTIYEGRDPASAIGPAAIRRVSA
jgi:hypothetical protein